MWLASQSLLTLIWNQKWNLSTMIEHWWYKREQELHHKRKTIQKMTIIRNLCITGKLDYRFCTVTFSEVWMVWLRIGIFFLRLKTPSCNIWINVYTVKLHGVVNCWQCNILWFDCCKEVYKGVHKGPFYSSRFTSLRQMNSKLLTSQGIRYWFCDDCADCQLCEGNAKLSFEYWTKLHNCLPNSIKNEQFSTEMWKLL